jgi:hypothetical protein
VKPLRHILQKNAANFFASLTSKRGGDVFLPEQFPDYRQKNAKKSMHFNVKIHGVYNFIA